MTNLVRMIFTSEFTPVGIFILAQERNLRLILNQGGEDIQLGYFLRLAISRNL